MLFAYDMRANLESEGRSQGNEVTWSGGLSTSYLGMAKFLTI